MDPKYDPNNLLKHNYELWLETEESTIREESLDLSDMQPLEGDNEVKELK